MGLFHWDELEALSPAVRRPGRRLFPESRQDLWYELSDPDRRRCLVVGLPDAVRHLDAESHRTRAVGVELQDRGARTVLILELLDNALAQVFDVLADDIATSIANLGTDEDITTTLTRRLGHWANLLARLSRTGDLSNEDRRGLFGELDTLRKIIPKLEPEVAVAGWTGPAATNQDFQLEAAALEVKTTAAKHPQTLMIANERELDPEGTGELLLLRISVDERRGGTGETLNKVVDELRAMLDAHPVARTEFERKLASKGFLGGAAYEEPRYTIRRRDTWRVHSDFPRITEVDLRSGVGDVRYTISTTGLGEYLVTLEEIDNVIRGNSHPFCAEEDSSA